ncbi:amidohydrolase family protein [Rhodospirillum sp. A1_3_36]|uniref:amidohydrolase family protein n=1 Tax=Rhodospirillum sp. A1_3_36 TaxID=3391666 RepID=UPI0039A6F3A5
MTICDCHIHSFAKTALPSGGAYAPPTKDLSDYVEEAAPHGISRAVIVQASVDGTDSSRLVSVLRSGARIATRGVATIDPDRADVSALHAAGVRAIRIQDRARLGASALGSLPELSRCVAPMGWHIELNTEPTSFSAIAEHLKRLPEGQILVLDHIGHVDPQSGQDMGDLRRLLDTGRVWVKLSLTRVGRGQGPDDHAHLVECVGQLVGTYPDQCIWGSDWPHVMTAPPLPQIPPMLDLFSAVLDPDQFRACMWTNPERLYAFEKSGTV